MTNEPSAQPRAIGAVADDFTGATDLACMLRRSGHRVAVTIEDAALPSADDLDAVVVALKTRTAPVGDAVAASRDALARLQAWGAGRYYVKYCSTFDSTDVGNIGPVLDAVSDDLGAGRTVVVPSLPENGRTVVDGLLRVHGVLLEESPMRHHPLTPMTQSRVADILRPQTGRAVAEIGLDVVRRGGATLADALAAEEAAYVVVDAETDADLAAIGEAVRDDVLVSGGSGLALGLVGGDGNVPEWHSPRTAGAVVLSGSVSEATRRQVATAAESAPVMQVDLVAAVRTPDAEVDRLVTWLSALPGDGQPPVVCAARTLDDVVPIIDDQPVAEAVEGVLAGLASRLVASGDVDSILVAGGESSGAVVRALDVTTLDIGPEIAPGVCWSAATTATGHRVELALKSGNFGADDLFTSAFGEFAGG